MSNGHLRGKVNPDSSFNTDDSSKISHENNNSYNPYNNKEDDETESGLSKLGKSLTRILDKFKSEKKVDD